MGNLTDKQASFVKEDSVQFSHSAISDSLRSRGCSTPDFPVHHHLLELAQTHVHRVDDAINYVTLCCSLLLLPSVFPSIRVFSNESALCIRWPKYWSFSFSISPYNEYSALVYFNIDWFDLLCIQGTLKSLLQHYSSKASIFWCSAFFKVNSHICIWLLRKLQFWLYGPLPAK